MSNVPKRGRPRDEEADERILDAAGRLLLERGFEGMTIDEVAHAAKAGKATVYRRWATKDDLAVAALMHLYRHEMVVPDTGSVRGDLHQWFSTVLAFTSDDVGAAYYRTSLIDVMQGSRIAELHIQLAGEREAGLADPTRYV